MEEMKVIEELIRMAREIKSTDSRCEALLGIGEALANTGRKEEGLRVLSEALASARAESDEESKVTLLLKTAICILPTGEVEKAIQLLREVSTSIIDKFADDEIMVNTLKEGLFQIFDILPNWSENIKRLVAPAIANFFEDLFPTITTLVTKFLSEMDHDEWDSFFLWDDAVYQFTSFLLSTKGIEAVLKLSNKISDQETRTLMYVALVSELASAGKYGDALEIMEKITDKEKGEVYWMIATGLINTGRIKEVPKIISELIMHSANDSPPAYREKMLELAREGETEKAFSLFGEFWEALKKWYELDKNTIIEELLKIADLTREIGELGKAKAVEIYREIERIAESEGGTEYFMRIGKLVAEMLKMGEKAEAIGKLAKAFDVIRGKERGYEKRESLERIVKALIEGISYGDALRVARDLEDPGIKAWMLWGISRVRGNNSTKTRRLDMLKEAVSYARAVKDEWERSQILALIAEDIAEEGDLDEAQWIARNIDDELERARVLLFVASLCQERGEKERGSKLAEEGLLLMEGKDYMGFSDELFARAAPLLVRGGKLNKALEILEKVRDDYYRAVALLEVARSLGEIGEREKARELLNESFEMVKNLKLETQGMKLKFLANIALEKVKIGDIEGALNIHSCYQDISQKLEQGHRCDELIRVVISERGVEEAEKVAEKIPGTRGRVQALVAIEKYMKEKGDEEGAKKIREKILLDLIEHPIYEVTPPDILGEGEISIADLSPVKKLDLHHDLMGSPVEIIEDTVPGYITVDLFYPPAVGVLRYFATFPENINEEISWVMNRLKSLDDEQGKADGIVGLARFVSRRLRDRVGEIFEEAIEIAKSIEDLFLKENALKEIGDSLVKAERFEKAKDIGREITDKSYRVELLLEVARARSILQKGEEIGEIVDEAISDARKIEKTWERSRALFKIAEYLIEQGNLDKAKEIAGQIEQADERNNIFVNIAKEMAKSGEIEGALNIARSIDDKIYKIRALLAIGEIISGKGESE